MKKFSTSLILCLLPLAFGCVKKNTTSQAKANQTAVMPSAEYLELEELFKKPGATVNMEAALRNIVCIDKNTGAKELGGLMFFNASHMSQLTDSLKLRHEKDPTAFLPGYIQDDVPILGLLSGNDLTGDYDLEIKDRAYQIRPFDQKRSITRPDSGNQFYVFKRYSPVTTGNGMASYTTVKMIDGKYVLQIALLEDSYQDLMKAGIPSKY